jgi:hypothetical protein
VPAVASRIFHAAKSGEVDVDINLQAGAGGSRLGVGMHASPCTGVPQRCHPAPAVRLSPQGLAIGNGLTAPAIQYGAYRWVPASAALPPAQLCCMPCSGACLHQLPLHPAPPACLPAVIMPSRTASSARACTTA